MPSNDQSIDSMSTSHSSPPSAYSTPHNPPSSTSSNINPTSLLQIDTSSHSTAPRTSRPVSGSTTPTVHNQVDPTTLQPPFPPSGVSPGSRQPQPIHPDAEAFVNTAAQHVFPEQPAPRISPGDQTKGVTREGRMSPSDRDATAKKNQDRGESERAEEPIIAGTPLDEMTPMKTPGVLSGGGAGFPFPPRRQESSATIRPQPRAGSGDTINASAGAPAIGAIPEHSTPETGPEHGQDAGSTNAQRPQRPLLRTQEIGSVCGSSSEEV